MRANATMRNDAGYDATKSHLQQPEEYSDDESIQKQEGVAKIEAISRAWTEKSLGIAYFFFFLLAVALSLDNSTVYAYQPSATSEFGVHSLLAVLLYAVIKPPTAKLADVFGRTESFVVGIICITIGFCMLAGANNFVTYAVAQIFYTAGQVAIQFMQQIFVADTTDFRWRSLFIILPSVPFLFTTWCAAPITTRILADSTWRWGYGMWAVIIPATGMPLVICLWLNQRKAQRIGRVPVPAWKQRGAFEYVKYVFSALDLPGMILLSAGLALFLLPFGLTTNGDYNQPHIIAMLVIGIVCLIAFPFYISYLAKSPLLRLGLLKDRTVVGGTCLVLFSFTAFYIYQPYYFSYLSVARNMSVTAATNITLIFTFSSTVSAVIAAVLIRTTKHYKYFMILGVAVYMIGGGLTYRYRNLESSQTQLVFAQIVLGAGVGFINSPAQLGVQAASSHQDVAAVTAIFLTMSSIGGAIGDAIAGAIWRNVLPGRLQALLPAEAQAQASTIFANYLTASSYPMGSPTRIAINDAYDYSMRILMIATICLMVPMFFFAAIMKNYRLDQIQQQSKGLIIGSSKRSIRDQGDLPTADTTQVISEPKHHGEAR